MRTLTTSIQNALAAAARTPAISVQLYDPIEHYSAYQTLGISEGYSAACVAADGALIRAYTDTPLGSFTASLFVQRISDAGNAGQWSTWTTLSSANLVRDAGCAVSNNGGTLLEVSTHATKLSQFCHGCGEHVPKSLWQRWHQCPCGIGPIQRDLYSAFLAAYLDPADLLPSCARQRYADGTGRSGTRPAGSIRAIHPTRERRADPAPKREHPSSPERVCPKVPVESHKSPLLLTRGMGNVEARRGTSAVFARRGFSARDATKRLDQEARLQTAYSSKALSWLLTELAARAGLFAVSIPATSQFSQLVPTFVLPSGHTLRQALNELCSIYAVAYFLDQSETLQFRERSASDASIWSYQPEIETLTLGSDDLRANHIIVTLR